MRSRLFADGATTATGEQKTPVPDHVPFGSSLSASLACWRLTTFISDSHMLTIPPTISPNRIEINNRYHPLTDQITSINAEATLSLAHFIQPGRIRVAEHSVLS